MLTTLAAIGWKVIPTIDIGPLSVSPHGLGIAVGYGVGGMVVARRAESRFGIPREDVWNMLMAAIFGVVVGARLFYVFGHLDVYLADPIAIFRVWEGGIVFYGGAIGGVAAAVPYMRKHGLPFWRVMDAAAPGFPIGLIFGRIGDLVIGDHLGKPTTMPWGFEYRGGQIPDPPLGLAVGDVFHQTALYDLVSVSLLLPFILWFGRKDRAPGVVFMTMVTWYAIGRFLTDFTRDAPLYGGLRGTQWVSVALITTGLIVLARRARGIMPAPPAAAVGEASVDDPPTPASDTGLRDATPETDASIVAPAAVEPDVETDPSPDDVDPLSPR
jgi:phosphatidylglycerol---prolipoprotein diacylglyceryl transferase